MKITQEDRDMVTLYDMFEAGECLHTHETFGPIRYQLTQDRNCYRVQNLDTGNFTRFGYDSTASQALDFLDLWLAGEVAAARTRAEIEGKYKNR